RFRWRWRRRSGHRCLVCVPTGLAWRGWLECREPDRSEADRESIGENSSMLSHECFERLRDVPGARPNHSPEADLRSEERANFLETVVSHTLIICLAGIRRRWRRFPESGWDDSAALR